MTPNEIRILDSRINELVQEGGFDLIFERIHKNIYSRIVINTKKEVHDELFYIMKGLREVESAIQESVNNTHNLIEEQDEH